MFKFHNYLYAISR